MPIYVYKCKKCSRVKEFVKSMDMSNTPEDCPSCGERMVKDMRSNMPNAHGDSYNSPIISHSMAMHPDQIAQHKRDHPDVRVTPDGCPVFDNYKTHDKYLSDTGFKKSEKKTKPRTSVRIPV